MEDKQLYILYIFYLMTHSAAHNLKRLIMTGTENNKQGGGRRLRRCSTFIFTRITTFLCRGL